MKKSHQGFTLIELLVVVAIIGIISAIGVVAYSGYKESAEKKKAELTLNSIYLAEEEYKSNNGSYFQSSSATQIATELFDGKNEDEFKNQNYQFSIKVSGDTFQIKAKHKTGSCTLTLNEKNKLTPSGC